MNNRQKQVQKQFLDDEEKVIKRLGQVYGKSLTDIEDKVKNLSFTIGKLQEEYDWLDDDDPKKAQVKSKIQSKIYQKQYQEQLKSQIDGVLKQMKTSQFTTISDYLDTCYTNGFIGSMFDAVGQGVPIITPINQEAMVKAVQLESKISKGLYTRLGEDVDGLKKKITAQVSRSIATGMSYDQTARALEGYTRIGYNNAIRIARTEGHRIQTTAAMDAMENAKAKGADVLKQWDATLDGATRESHAKVDGEIREVNQPFSNGLMYPGDPNGGAGEVVNCRCALLQRARWALEDDDQSFTKFNGFTQQVEEFDSPESYGEFKKAFFSNENKRYMNYVEQMEDKYGTRDFPNLLNQMSTQEYNHYSKLLGGNPVYNKNGKLLTNDGHDDIIEKNDGFRQIVGNHSIEDDIGTTETPTCNPRFHTDGIEYKNNCGNCTAAFEMRRRGLDVIANPRNTMPVAEWMKLFDGFEPMDIEWQSGMSYWGSLRSQILQEHGEGARGGIFVAFKGRRVGHFFSWEVENGVVRFVDGQSGETDVNRYFKTAVPNYTICGRWDHLNPSDLIKQACKNRGGD